MKIFIKVCFILFSFSVWAYDFTGDVKAGYYHYLPLHVQVVSEGNTITPTDENLYQYVEAAIEDWETKVGMDIFDLAPNIATPASSTGKNTIRFVSMSEIATKTVLNNSGQPVPANPNSTVAITERSTNGSAVFDHFNIVLNKDLIRNNALLLTISTTHELGHAVGLAHSSDNSAIMYYTTGLATDVEADDVSGMQALVSEMHHKALTGFNFAQEGNEVLGCGSVALVGKTPGGFTGGMAVVSFMVTLMVGFWTASQLRKLKKLGLS